MSWFQPRRLAALVLIAAAAAAPVRAEERLISTMRNVNAVMEARGFRIIPAPDLSGDVPLGDEAPVFAVEIVRPRGEKISISRLFTSCTCVQLETEKHTFEEGERAVLRLRNVIPTPAAGQIYALYVQVTSPIRTTLRYDTFVQSTRFLQSIAAPPVFTAATAPAAPAAGTDAAPADAEAGGSKADKPEGGEIALDKYGAAPEPEDRPRGETEAFKAAEALKEQKEREARAAGEAIIRTEELLKTRREEVAAAEELLKTRRGERKAAAEELERAEAALEEAIDSDALRRRELLASEEDLDAYKREKEIREREAQKAAVAIEALREVAE